MPETPNLTVTGHLEELRNRLWIAFVAVALCVGVCFFFSDALLRFLLKPIQPDMGVVYFFSPPEAFLIKVKAAFLVGLIAASPVVLTQAWLFLGPALYIHEKKFFFPVIFSCSFLFICGAVFSFFTVIPLALKFFLSQQNDFLKPMISISSYMDFLTTMLLAFGISFNLPIFILTLVFFGFLKSQILIKYQRHAVVIIFIAAAAITPGPDVTSQLLLAIPLFVLFEISVVGALLIEKFKVKKVNSA